MICVVIRGPTITEVYLQVKESLAVADFIELRLDLFSSRQVDEVAKLCKTIPIPMIFTLRSALQGGGYDGNEEQRLKEILQLASIRPSFFDLESHLSCPFIEKFRMLFPEIEIILSYHDFEGVPNDLEFLYQNMSRLPVFYCKIAVTPSNSIEALQFLSWAAKYSKKMIAIGMGYYGQITRVLAPVFGFPFTYASLREDLSTATGQISAKILIEQYHYHELSTKTALYGLIGDPVEGSVSDVTHNKMIPFFEPHGLYIKIPIKKEELQEFVFLAKSIGFKGLSVTMPLKELIIDLLDDIDSGAARMGAVNTLRFEAGKVVGYNTDGVAALDALESHGKVSGKQVVVLGSGGAARAIIDEALQRGAEITLVSRNREKALKIAENTSIKIINFDELLELPLEYDILINCTPHSMPIPAHKINRGSLIMDIQTKPMRTELLETAEKLGCCLVYGYEMFIQQALGQFKIWFKKEVSLEMEEFFEDTVKKSVKIEL
jgi:3-dehydroquinate dehydratase / shikimate dehydrogenase